MLPGQVPAVHALIWVEVLERLNHTAWAGVARMAIDPDAWQVGTPRLQARSQPLPLIWMTRRHVLMTTATLAHGLRSVHNWNSYPTAP